MRNGEARVAFVPDWLTIEGGAERVGLEFLRLLPTADVHTTFFQPRLFDGAIDPRRVRTWPLHRLFGPTRRFRQFLPLYPLWYSRLDLTSYELVLSGSIAFTHSVRSAARATHVAYVYTPLRYAWDLDVYLEGSSLPLGARIAARMLRPALQRWDRWAAMRPDVIVGISNTVRERIQRLWSRDAEVIYPPVDTAEIGVSNIDDGYLLVAARMLSYRRLDLAIEAANRIGRQLVVVGDGPERRRLEALAGPRVRFTGWVDRRDLVDLIGRCHAYVVPGVEDFGIAPVEAMAAGKPVIGFRGGGVAETVVNGETGLLFDTQSVDAIVHAIGELERMSFDQSRIRARAEEFSTPVFHRRFVDLFQRLGVDPDLYVNYAAGPATTIRRR